MSTLLEKLNKEELLQATANDPFESFALAKKYVEKYKEPPEELVRGLTKRKKEEWTGSNYNHSVAYAMLAIDHDIKVPDYVLESILENEYDAYDYLVKMIKYKRIIPDNFLNAYFEKHYEPPEALEQKPIFGQDYGYSKDVEIWYDYTEMLLNKNVEIPENVINAVSKSIYYSERLIEHLLYKKRDVPEILLKSVSLSPQYSYYSATHFIEYDREVPEILNQVIAKNPVYQDMYDGFLLERGKKKKINESVVINEKLDKEELKQAFFRNPNTTFDYVKKRFLNRNEFPPEEFINAIAESAYASKKYIDYVINAMGFYNFKPPKILIQRIIENGDMSLNLLKTRYGIKNNDFDLDSPILESISDQDLLKSIVKEGYLSFGAYQIYKGKGMKIPPILWKSILSNPTASLYVARELLQNDEPIPEAVIKGVTSKAENAFVFAFDLLKKNVDLPEVLLKALAEDPDMARIDTNLDNLLINYAKLRKEIPDTLIDAAANKKWRDKNLYILCRKFAMEGLKIPDKILNTFIEKTPQYGVTQHLGVASYDILLKYIENAPDTMLGSYTIEDAFKIIPSKLYQYVITPDIAGVSRTKNLIQNFLSNFNKVPEDFKQTIIDNYKEFGHKIPKDIADAAGIKQSETINEKLDKDELLNTVFDSWTDARRMIFDLTKIGKEIPDKLAILAAENMPASTLTFVATDIIEFGKNKVPEIILKGISKNKEKTKQIAMVYKNYNQEIPKIIIDALNPKQKEFYNSAWFRGIKKPLINEKLDKSELLGVIQKDYDGYIQIMDFYFRNKKEYPPEEFLKMATETDEASRIFAEYCLEMKKDIPDEVIEKVAENPRGAYTIAALMIMEERKVPEILIKSINSDPLSKKQFEEFAKKEEYRIYIPTLYYGKI